MEPLIKFVCQFLKDREVAVPYVEPDQGAAGMKETYGTTTGTNSISLAAYFKTGLKGVTIPAGQPVYAKIRGGLRVNDAATRAYNDTLKALLNKWDGTTRTTLLEITLPIFPNTVSTSWQIHDRWGFAAPASELTLASNEELEIEVDIKGHGTNTSYRAYFAIYAGLQTDNTYALIPIKV